MELTRRDVIAALAATGAAVGAGATLIEEPDGDPVGGHEVETLVAVAGVVYPSAVEGVESFVRQYSVNRVRDRPEYAAGVGTPSPRWTTTAVSGTATTSRRSTRTAERAPSTE